jgi:hypothetical protein
MKCNRVAVYGWKSKKAIKKNPIILYTLNSPSDIDLTYIPKSWIISNQEICNGEIESKVEMEGIPFFWWYGI